MARWFALLLVIATIPSATRPLAESLTPFIRLSGQGVGFGYSVAGSADINGDGFDDLIVGDPTNYSFHVPGHAHVFFGGPQMDSIPDVTLTGPGPVPWESLSAISAFGIVVSSAGDVNGDKYADLLVSSPFSGRSGRVYVYLGGPAMTAAPPLVLEDMTSPYYIGSFGMAIAPAGDFNGDGRADFVVGAPDWNTYDYELGRSSGEVGRAFLYFGGDRPDSIADLVLDTPSPRFYGPDYHYGYSVASAGDINGDGFADILISQAMRGPGAYPCCYGTVLAYWGGPTTNGMPGRSFRTAPLRISPGPAVSSIGDFNGDGYGDIAVSAIEEDPNGHSSVYPPGHVYVYYGSPLNQDDPMPDLTLSGDPADRIGACLAGGRDVNGDGYPDLLASDPFHDGYGKVYVFYGGTNADSIPDVVLKGNVFHSYFGNSVSAADMNGDGIADVIVGSPPSRFSSSAEPGHVYVYDLSTPLAARAFVRGEHRAIPLVEAPPQVCVRFEPVGGSYDNASVDLSTVRLISSGTGAVGEIVPVETKTALAGDSDRDGVAELSACFDRADLVRLFGSIRGRQTIVATLEGRLVTHRRFRAALELTIVGMPAAERRITASVSPNPINPRGVLKFTMGAPGNVTARLFDVSGRLVRTLAHRQYLEAGEHSVAIDALDDHGTELATGVYFYRIETSDATSEGRFVVAR